MIRVGLQQSLMGRASETYLEVFTAGYYFPRKSYYNTVRFTAATRNKRIHNIIYMPTSGILF